ncbi:MAG: restriction endonuclease [Janthinobacterium lividum]
MNVHGTDLHGLMWLVVVALAVRYGLPFFFAFRRKQRYLASGIADIDAMDGKAFEQYLEALLRQLGYKVELTRYVGDYGADLITYKNNVKTVVQAKRYAKAVGIKAVQEAVAAKEMYACTEAMVVTNSTFTRAAMELAKANRVLLWDRARLVEAILQVQSASKTQDIPKIPDTPGVVPATSVSSSQLSASASSEASFPACEAFPPAAVSCATCGSAVSEKVQQYCAAHPARFGGRIYCFQHQKTIKRQD